MHKVNSQKYSPYSSEILFKESILASHLHLWLFFFFCNALGDFAAMSNHIHVHTYQLFSEMGLRLHSAITLFIFIVQ